MLENSMTNTNNHEKVRIGSIFEVRDPDGLRQCFLPLKLLIQACTEGWLHTQGLQHKYTHADDSLFCGIAFILHGMENHEHDKVVNSVSVDDEGSESLVALKHLPKQHDHFC